jgi:hypothetical protein
MDVQVIDNTPPVISNVSANPSLIYPPNHKMRDIALSYAVTDNCGAVTTKVSVASNESANGPGDGNSGSDWIIVDDHHLQLRAERSGNGTGRIYTITITATDAAGNSANATTKVTVPHDNAVTVKTTPGKILPEEALNGLKVQAFPNPTSDGFTIITQSSSMDGISIRVIDDLGRIVEQRTGLTSNGKVYIGRSYLPGMYFVKIEQGQTFKMCKVIKHAR